jgi:hypothetical protein
VRDAGRELRIVRCALLHEATLLGIEHAEHELACE